MHLTFALVVGGWMTYVKDAGKLRFLLCAENLTMTAPFWCFGGRWDVRALGVGPFWADLGPRGLSLDRILSW